MISVGAVIVYVSGIYSTIVAYSQYLPQNPYVCSSTACGISAIFAVGGLGVILLGLRGLWRFLTRTGYVQLKRPEASPQIGTGPEDEKVLAIGREAFGRVRQRRRRKTEAVYWSENAGWYWCHPTRREVKPPGFTVSASLRGKLNTEDWKVLFTYYSLQFKPSIRIASGFFFMLFVPLFVFSVAALEVSAVYGLLVGALFGRIIGAPLAAFLLVEVFHQGKIMFLKQDRWIAQVLGAKPLLDVFQKIDWLELPDVENGKRRKGWIAWIWPMPNMTERLDNLSLLT